MKAINDLIKPSLLPSLKNDYELKVYIVRDPLRPPKEPTRLSSIFPFSTIEDVKRAIWLHEDAELNALPKFQFLGILRENPYETEFPAAGQKYIGADYYYYDTTDIPIRLDSPLDILRSGAAHENFVDIDGRLQPLKITKRDRIKLETIFEEEESPVLHCYFLSSVLAFGNLANPISEYDFNGKIAPYFPSFSVDSEFTPTENDIAFAETLETYARGKSNTQEAINTFLEDNQEKLKKLKISGIVYLRFAWKQPIIGFQRCQALFYNLAANDRRPFIRFLPVDSTPLTKLYSPGGLTLVETISIDNVKNWAQEKSPVPDKDYIFMKVLIHTGGSSSLFGTLRIHDDGTADFILTPPKNMRKLEAESDLRDLEAFLTEAIQKTGLVPEQMGLEEASVNVYLNLDPEAPKISKADIHTRLKKLSTFFQEIDPLPNEQPLIMLRYKGVSNFANEDSVSIFLTQIAAKNIQNGVEINRVTFRRQVIDEFGIDDEEAKTRVNAWFNARTQFGVANAEKSDVKPLSNPGVDIAVFEQHPYYFFHIYRADGNNDLRRIYTLLSILFSVSKDDLDGETVSEDVEQAVESFTDETGEVVNPESPVAEDSPQNVLVAPSEAQDGADEDFGDFLAYAVGDEDETQQEEATSPYEGAREELPTELPPPVVPDRPTDAGIEVGIEEPQQQPQPQKVKIKLKKKTEAAPDLEPAAAPVDEGPIKVGSFLIDRLKKLDKELFAYKKPTKADKSTKHYSSGCQAQDDRQPLGVTALEYKIMRERYAKEIDEKKLFFMEYPILGTTNPENPPRDAEIVNVLKFGSDPAHQNYYLCPKYFCIRDNIIIMETEFNGLIDRQGKRKKRESCPFCHGTKILDKNNPGRGETVFIRKNKPKTEKPHIYIDLLSKQRNPQGIALPCCFADPNVVGLRKTQAEFTHIREYEEKQGIRPAEKPATKAQTIIQPSVVNYEELSSKLSSEYIVGPEKYPLEPGKVGICAPVLDSYLGQVSSSFVQRSAVRQELTPNAEGFLRIGVDNPVQRRNISILAALAPFLHKVDTPQQVAGYIWEKVYPPVFQNLNFGNLVLEFYDPSFESPTSDNELSKWARNWFDVQDLSKNRDHFIRLWKSYNKFISLLKNVQEGKNVKFQFELRHFVHMLAEPGILSRRGITLIVLEYSGTPVDPKTEVTVKCPLQGFNSYAHANNDIGFLTHSSQGAWEPLIYTENTPPKGEQVATTSGTYLFQASLFNKYSETVRARITEFRQKCNSSGLGAFTPTTGVDPQSLIPKYKLLYQSLKEASGVLRDSYNHLVGAVFNYPRTKKRIYHVFVPFADDGTLFNVYRGTIAEEDKMFQINRVHFGFDDLSPSPVDWVIKFYKEFIQERFSLYKGYGVRSIITFNNNRVAVQLENGILIPATLNIEPTNYPDIPIINAISKDPEWYIDSMIVAPEKKDDSGFAADKTVFLERRKAEEVYNHLRLTFANYAASSDAGPEFRKTIRQIIGRTDLDLYERRKRLEIVIGPFILSWLTPTDSFDPTTTLLRIDCRITDKEQCDNFCIWKEEVGKCSIHTPSTVTLGGREEVNAPRFFMLRLLEELLRIPTKRKQLLTRGVPYLSAPKTQVKIGEQTIIPEHNTQWYQALIEEIMAKPTEKPIYYEEFAGTRQQIQSQFLDRMGIPESLREIIGPGDFRLWPAHDIYSLCIALNVDIGTLTQKQDLRKFDQQSIVILQRGLKPPKTVIQIDLSAGGQMIGSSVKTQDIVVIVILETGQPAILVNTDTPNVPLIFKNTLVDTLELKINAIPQVFYRKRPNAVPKPL